MSTDLRASARKVLDAYASWIHYRKLPAKEGPLADAMVTLLEAVDATPAPESPAPAPDCNRCGDTGSIGHSQGFDGEAYEIDCPECHPDAPEVGTGSETSPDAGASIREALELAIKEFAHDVPGSCWSTGPLTGTAEDDMCRGCKVIRAANSALSLLAKPAEASDAEQIPTPHPVAEAEQSSQPAALSVEAHKAALAWGGYARHWNTCPAFGLGMGDNCDCGLDRARKAFAEAVAQAPTRTAGKGPQ